MAEFVWHLNLNGLGVGGSPDKAREDAISVLFEAIQDLQDGRLPTNPNVGVLSDDPGGGGPCRPWYIRIWARIRPVPNPRARSRDD